MTEIEQALEPCPFCESKAKPWPHPVDHNGYFQVHCGGCFCEGPVQRTKKSAIAAWNTRPSPGADVMEAREIAAQRFEAEGNGVMAAAAREGRIDDGSYVRQALSTLTASKTMAERFNDGSVPPFPVKRQEAQAGEAAARILALSPENRATLERVLGPLRRDPTLPADGYVHISEGALNSLLSVVRAEGAVAAGGHYQVYGMDAQNIANIPGNCPALPVAPSPKESET